MLRMEKSEILPFFSVIIPVYNEEQFIRRNIESLLDQDYPYDRYEIIAVDGGSTDGSMKIIQEFTRTGRVKILDNPAKIAASAINIGIKNSKGEVITRVDAHSYVAKDYLSSIAKVFRETGEKAVGGPVRMVTDTLFRKALARVLNSKFGVGAVPYRTLKQRAYVDSIQTGSFKREVLEKVGYFDETLPPGEDFDLNTRIRKAGFKILLDPDIKFYYYPRNCIGSLMKQYFHYGRVKPIVLSKHPEAFRVKYVIPSLFVAFLFFSLIVLFLPLIMKGRIFGPVFALLSVYLLYIVLVGSFWLSSVRRIGIGASFLILVIIPSIHISYGAGFLYGALCVMKRMVLKGRNSIG